MKKISGFLILFILFISTVYAASPDGLGPWADEVVSYSQGLMKNGQPVPAIRSNPQAAIGPAENDNNDGFFFSLGFGGHIVLRFDNGVRDGVVVIESTWPNYPDEKAKIEVSQDGTTWIVAGTVVQDGEVTIPSHISCVNYVKITDISNPSDFPDDIADGYDVDGVKAVNAQPCSTSNTGGEITPTPTQSSSGGNNSNNSSASSSSNAAQCTAGKPGTPKITSVNKTSPTTVNLTWTAVSPVTTYAIFYGISPGNYQYAVPSTGNVTSFVVGGLDPNATYYFQVRGVNDCMPGDGSQEQSAGGQVLGASTEGQVLGASTEVLGATGNFEHRMAAALSILGGLLFYGFYKRFAR
jgi:hypothetical protein